MNRLTKLWLLVRLMGDGSEYMETAVEAVIEVVSMRCSSLVHVTAKAGPLEDPPLPLALIVFCKYFEGGRI